MIFRAPAWQEVRLDIDPQVRPDLMSTVVDMKDVAADQSFDALWSSHNIEHLYDHEVLPAFAEFRRILRPDGFALITCPDLQAVAGLIAEGRLEEGVYEAPSGPVTPLDMIYGFRPSIAAGNDFMGHRTGFTTERLGRLLVETGFAEVRMIKGESYDLWALALMPEIDAPRLMTALARTGLKFQQGD
ncbi:methyltransferase domain-containing protein [Aurantimonas sp. VKM B-3413]|uniref:class I SAM-dependent methyltransferase n=1 Tax=Aurantimonas sp. VKM B-3413 TaxID=2779401 RepID=UPI001E3A6B5E|nr:methyltransferase domain-containing protein [Aurantimonas sp. VKM B-3413]MCB8836487.1 class I SAM-dependent methyltransferase [Aurantimonas sp. VKM B-3413]